MAGGRARRRLPVSLAAGCIVRTELLPRYPGVIRPCRGLASHGYSGYVHRGISRVRPRGYILRLTTADPAGG
jgi:hypothetical protein